MAKGIILNDTQISQLAELAKIPAETVVELVDSLYKLGYDIRPVNEWRVKRGSRNVIETSLRQFITDFITKKIEVPRNLDRIFPINELTLQIVENYFEDMKEVKK